VDVVRSLFYFFVAGLCEIAGGYLVWIWLREGRSAWFGLTGAVVLALCGFVPTLQPAHFGRVYAAYGGVFAVMSILWGWKVDDFIPDRYVYVAYCTSQYFSLVWNSSTSSGLGGS
jgi:small multidrug resistance family-3 protein